MTAILGISAFYHDAAAALVVDGRIVAAAQEERFTRRKHDPRFPARAIEYCLSAAGLSPADLDYVGFYEKPFTKFERLLRTYLSFAPAGYRSFRQALPVWMREKLHLRRVIREGLGGRYHGPLFFTDHHESHAASAFFPSPFDEAAILTIDGVGEWSTTCYGVGRGRELTLTHEIRFPHSLGLLYSAFTYYLGFKVNSGEYKVMGLAPYGRPVYRDLILEHLIDLKPDGSFRLDQRYFHYCQGLTMTSPRFHRLFGGPPRPPESRLTQREMDLAASLQAVTEEVMLRLARHVHATTGQKRLVLAGGVALNCVGNGRILREGPFEDLWIQPAAGDAGGALGVALFLWHQLLGQPRDPQGRDAQQGSFLGPSYSDAAIAAVLRGSGARFSTCDTDEELCAQVAEHLEAGRVVGWFQGRMEFGPRALGARSILADARHPGMQSLLNLKVKFRESFRPFAPIVMQEYAHEYFDLREGQESPYMLLTAPVREALRTPPGPDDERLFGIERLQRPRSVIPAVTHVDYSARVQTVDAARNPLLHRLLDRFRERTGCPVLVNTSFNVRGEPIVCTPQEAWRCFQMTDIDVLAIGRHLAVKEEQRETADEAARAAHRAAFAAD
jgi:carbamoyltransferase